MSNEEVEKLRKKALLMADEDVKKTIFSEKYKELFTWKKVFDEIQNPKLSNSDQLTIDRVENCIEKIHKSNEDPDALIHSLLKIIENQEVYA